MFEITFWSLIGLLIWALVGSIFALVIDAIANSATRLTKWKEHVLLLVVGGPLMWAWMWATVKIHKYITSRPPGASISDKIEDWLER